MRGGDAERGDKALDEPVEIPRWTDDPDFFVWAAFDQASQDPTRRLGTDATQQEALLAETGAFYAIPDQFGVVSGHTLILPKAVRRSMADLDARHDAELRWLLTTVRDVVASAYQANTVVAEHGECGCATAGQAHVHVLPIPSITSARLRAIVDEVLVQRMVGIERVVYRDTEFTALEDLQALAGLDGARVLGRQVQTRDLVGPVNYPADARSSSELSRPYVYFSCQHIEFLSTHHFRSQFVREVVGRAVEMPGRQWDRWVNTSREHMFLTFERLAPAFHARGHAAFGFTPRAGRW